MAKIRNFGSFWGYSHISAPINVKFVTGKLAKFHVYRGNVSLMRCENLFLDYWVKTIPAMPVKLTIIVSK